MKIIFSLVCKDFLLLVLQKVVYTDHCVDCCSPENRLDQSVKLCSVVDCASLFSGLSHSGELLPFLPYKTLTEIQNWHGDCIFLLSIQLSLLLFGRLDEVVLFK